MHNDVRITQGYYFLHYLHQFAIDILNFKTTTFSFTNI